MLTVNITLSDKEDKPDTRMIRLEVRKDGKIYSIYEQDYPLGKSIIRADTNALRRFAKMYINFLPE